MDDGPIRQGGSAGVHPVNPALEAAFYDLQKGLRSRFGDDIAQATFVKLLERPDLAPEFPHAYILRVALNCQYEHFRQSKRVMLPLTEAMDVAIPGQALDLAEARQWLERLDPRLIRDGMGYDDLETANDNTTRTRRRRLRERGKVAV